MKFQRRDNALTDPTVWLDDTYDDSLYPTICECGVCIDVPGFDECSVCAGAPHERECHCDECEAYWAPFCSPPAKGDEAK